ncbi:MAG: hypothetical protein IIA07_04685 [Proteobacteria bacterium]|nr:hypothetical protein [Pseudomonadota bacterium]
MSERDPIRVFITHTFEESEDYLRVFEFLEGVDRFFYLNVSKPENIPSAGGEEAIKDELIAQIKASESIIVLPQVYEQRNELVSFMMDVADANDISIIAIRPFGGKTETPEAVADRAKVTLDWNAREIADTLTFLARGETTQRWEVVDFPGLDSDESN